MAERDDAAAEPEVDSLDPGPGAAAKVAGANDANDEGGAAVEHDLESLVRERDELLDTTRRLQADFENFRKRMVREQTAIVDRAAQSLVEQLLPVLDSFEMALLQLEADADVDRVRKGVELVFAELLGVLEKAGLERVTGAGEAFDPNVHEAVLHEEGDADPTVDEVMRTGYKLRGRVVRPAMVKVTRAGSADEGEATGTT